MIELIDVRLLVSRTPTSLSHRNVASGASYGSGLPFECGGDQSDAIAQYGEQVVGCLNFSRGRVLPQLAVNASMGVDAYNSERLRMRLQVDGDNLNNRLNVIDFGGLFSGNAGGPARSYNIGSTRAFRTVSRRLRK